jgi:hypothetical protein
MSSRKRWGAIRQAVLTSQPPPETFPTSTLQMDEALPPVVQSVVDAVLEETPVAEVVQSVVDVVRSGPTVEGVVDVVSDILEVIPEETTKELVETAADQINVILDKVDDVIPPAVLAQALPAVETAILTSSSCLPPVLQKLLRSLFRARSTRAEKETAVTRSMTLRVAQVESPIHRTIPPPSS